MSDVLENLRYTEEHEYVMLDDNGLYIIGITDYAQGELGDVVFVNLPKTGEKYEEHQAFGVVEAVKAVSDLYCPVSGEIVAINDALDADPGLVNRDPYGDGWMIKLRPSDPASYDRLLPAADYRAHIGE
ncbi:MAG: glycine cleavage system protein GcvH [Gemmatimonadales bacterium]